jgi:hypothetical protein
VVTAEAVEAAESAEAVELAESAEAAVAVVAVNTRRTWGVFSPNTNKISLIDWLF